MKNFFKFGLIAAALVSSSAFAADVGGDATGSIAFDGDRINNFAGADAFYVVSDFSFHLSNNVDLFYTQNRNTIAVSTSTPRGRNVFSGSSAGGSVSVCGEATAGNDEPAAAAPSVEAEDENGCADGTNASPRA
ncbi:hypothetical protein [Lampropedia hyalina]|uniref:hypothetical protein n=1 Tax=Lampropedia hyalina TaxID=198706 RepID=UPI001160FF50|nr:hypothetical protein [Lampropedia hyalina]